MIVACQLWRDLLLRGFWGRSVARKRVRRLLGEVCNGNWHGNNCGCGQSRKIRNRFFVRIFRRGSRSRFLPARRMSRSVGRGGSSRDRRPKRRHGAFEVCLELAGVVGRVDARQGRIPESGDQASWRILVGDLECNRHGSQFVDTANAGGEPKTAQFRNYFCSGKWFCTKDLGTLCR